MFYTSHSIICCDVLNLNNNCLKIRFISQQYKIMCLLNDIRIYAPGLKTN